MACGPSFQAVYECDVRFEHCYALEQRDASKDSMKECWRAWLRGYTYGQSRDRVEYAAARYAQLSLGPSLASEEGEGAGPPRRPPIVASPVPTNAFAPPPRLAVSVQPDGGALSSSQEAMLRAPGAECSDGCSSRWTRCREGCKDQGCDDCDTTYRACMPACFRDDASSRPSPRTVR